MGGWVDVDVMGGGEGTGKTNGIEFQSDGAWPGWPTRTAKTPEK